MPIFGYSKLSHDQAKLFIINCYMGVLRRYPEREVLEKNSYEISSGRKSCLEFLSGIVRSKEFRNISGFIDFLDLSQSYVELEFTNKPNSGKIKNVVYLGFSVNRPIGGMKVIFHHAQIINSFADAGIKTQIFFPEAIDFDITWMDINVDVKRDNMFDVSNDLVIIPEVWAWYYGSLFKKAGLRYAIFVQNGYLLFHELGGQDKLKLKELRDVYASAEIILSISDDVTQCIHNTYSEVGQRIIQLNASINKDLFYPESTKTNTITYMPRKLSTHSSWLVSYLGDKIPASWQILPIDNMTEKQVAEMLRMSKIFLSFSDQEGLGLPPLEAAISGNKVIGYTGQAGKEYWSGQIFHEIECGDLVKFAKVVIEEIKKIEQGDGLFTNPQVLREIEWLSERYSVKKEIESLRKLTGYISKL